ncbi:hypothetical protein ACCC97_19360 [Variovorax sp. Varisp85]|uniref:hypothetical protein n=1 Tax=unclassified Variovorax TaxID=663243 RepID=UPI0012F7A441|nr:hypothetical protein [Variovorax sp. CF313]
MSAPDMYVRPPSDAASRNTMLWRSCIPFLYEARGTRLHAFDRGFTGRLLGNQQHAAPRDFVPQFGPRGVGAIKRNLELYRAAPAFRQIGIHQDSGHGL